MTARDIPTKGLNAADIELQWKNVRWTLEREMGTLWMDEHDPDRNIYLPGLVAKALEDTRKL